MSITNEKYAVRYLDQSIRTAYRIVCAYIGERDFDKRGECPCVYTNLVIDRFIDHQCYNCFIIFFKILRVVIIGQILESFIFA